jgi:predicted negative regulator of RcsB-dependent stress response
MTKRKEERRELLKQDEFLTRMERVLRALQENPRHLFLAGAAFLLVLALIVGFQVFRSNRVEEGALALFQGEKILLTELDDAQAERKFASEAEKQEAALVEFERAIATQSGEIQAQARIRAIGCLVNLGRPADTLPHYQALSKSQGVYAPIGFLGMGDCLREQGDFKAALDAYNAGFSVVTDKDTLFDLFKYRMAQTYVDSGDSNNAIAELEALVSKYADDPGSQPPYFSKAKTMLEDLRKAS